MRRTAWWVLVALGTAALASLGPRPAAADEPGSGNKGTVVSLDGLQSRAPADWKEAETSGQFRAYQFQVPRADGDKADADVIVFFFGTGSGGSVAQNIPRWKGQFNPPEGKTIDDVSKLERFKVGDVDVAYFDVTGTYKFKARPFDPNAREELRPDYRMIMVYFGTKKGPYFIRFIGPAKTVTQHKKGFDEWVKGFK
jgi:hypothetical protein